MSSFFLPLLLHSLLHSLPFHLHRVSVQRTCRNRENYFVLLDIFVPVPLSLTNHLDILDLGQLSLRRNKMIIHAHCNQSILCMVYYIWGLLLSPQFGVLYFQINIYQNQFHASDPDHDQQISRNKMMAGCRWRNITDGVINYLLKVASFQLVASQLLASCCCQLAFRQLLGSFQLFVSQLVAIGLVSWQLALVIWKLALDSRQPVLASRLALAIRLGVVGLLRRQQSKFRRTCTAIESSTYITYHKQGS